MSKFPRKSHLLSSQRREAAKRAETSSNIPKLAKEYDITEQALRDISRRWKLYKRLHAYFADLVSKMQGF